MLILIKTQKAPEQRFLVNLQEPWLVDEVRSLIDESKHSKAVRAVLSKGKFIREVSEEDIHLIDVNIILTEKNAHYNLM